MTEFDDVVARVFLERVSSLVETLRKSGVDVSLSESVEAVQSLQYLDIGHRDVLFRCLQAVTIKRQRDIQVFEDVFDNVFSTAFFGQFLSDHEIHEPGISNGSSELPGGVSTSDSVNEKILAALLDGLGDETLKLLASQAVSEHSGMDSTKSGEKYYLHRVMRAIDIGNILVSAMREARIRNPDASELKLRLMRDEFNQQLERYRELLAREIRIRMRKVDQKPGTGLIAPRRIEELDFLAASNQEMQRMRQAIRPLARRLASKIGQRRKNHSDGRLDMRRTTRRSLNFGGVPIETILKRKRPQRPQVVVLCDISGSVAEFAHFTLMLLHAMQDELSSLRSFVFVDGVAEVSHLLKNANVTLDPRLLVTLPGVVVNDGHSDYSHALTTLAEQFGDVLTSSTTLIITGDARTNYKPTGDAVLADIAKQVKHLYWFNPESSEIWSESDSVIETYRTHCEGIYEVRNLDQLASAIAEIV